MNPHALKLAFPHASASTLAANAGDYGPGAPSPVQTMPASAPEAAKQAQTAEKPKKIGKRRKAMNQTETDFAQRLNIRMQANEIVSFEYEGMTLRWGKLDNIQYTPDFVVFEAIHSAPDCSVPFARICFIETKGAHIWPKDIAKFKQARNEWPLFGFEMWQRKKGQWSQLY